MNDNKTSCAGETANAQTLCEINPPRRILVVEDNDCVRCPNAEVLIRSVHQVDTAENGAVAWQMLQLKHYDLLVTDNVMPKVSGVELLKKLHAASITLPVIMATSTPPEAEFTRNLRLRPAALLLKPFAGDDLSGAVEKVLHMSDSARPQLRPIH